MGILKLLTNAIAMVSGSRNPTGISTGIWKNSTKGIRRYKENFFFPLYMLIFFLNLKLFERQKVLMILCLNHFFDLFSLL